MKVQTALDKVFAEMEFGQSYGGYNDKWVRISLGLPVGIWIPNLNARKQAIKIHDINHLITGYTPKDFMGEIEESFFELGAGCGHFYFAWIINATVIGMIFFAPKKCSKAFIRGWNSKSLYKHINEFPNIYEMEVDDLKEQLQIASV